MIRCLVLSIVAVGLVAGLGCSSKSPQQEAIALEIKNLEILDYDEYRETIARLAEFGEPAVEPLFGRRQCAGSSDLVARRRKAVSTDRSQKDTPGGVLLQVKGEYNSGL